MGIVPKYSNDVFISYAHDDNLKLAEHDRGWVTDFRDTLELLLRPRSSLVQCWKDDQMRAGEVITDALRNVIEQTAVFVPVISRAYLRSKFCTLELAQFCAAHQDFSGRIVAIVIDDTPIDNLPENVKRAKAIRFTERNEAAKTEYVLPKPLDRQNSHPYWVNMAAAMEGTWKILEQSQRPTNEPSTPIAMLKEEYGSALPVYLAEVTDDLVDQRTLLLSVLEKGSVAQGLIAQPQMDLMASPDVLGACRDALARSNISIHMISRARGRVWGNSVTPVVQMQVEQALLQEFKLRPIVWLAPDVEIEKIADKEHQTFIQSLSGRAEVIQMNIEKFLSLMQTRFFPPAAPVWRAMRGPQSLLVYLAHCGQPEAATQAQRQLAERRCAIAQLDYRGEPDAQQRHEVNVKNCDGMVILYDDHELSWAEQLAQDAWIRSRQSNRPRMVAAVSTVPMGEHHFGFQHDHLVTVETTSTGALGPLEPFLTALMREADV